MPKRHRNRWRFDTIVVLHFSFFLGFSVFFFLTFLTVLAEAHQCLRLSSIWMCYEIEWAHWLRVCVYAFILLTCLPSYLRRSKTATTTVQCEFMFKRKFAINMLTFIVSFISFIPFVSFVSFVSLFGISERAYVCACGAFGGTSTNERLFHSSPFTAKQKKKEISNNSLKRLLFYR